MEQTTDKQPVVLESKPKTSTHSWLFIIMSIICTLVSIIALASLVITYVYYQSILVTDNQLLIITPSITGIELPTTKSIKIDSTNDPYYITQIELTFPAQDNVQKTSQAVLPNDISVVKVNNSELTFRSIGRNEYNYKIFYGISEKILSGDYLKVLTKTVSGFSYYTIGMKNTWDEASCIKDKVHCYFQYYYPTSLRWDTNWEVSLKIPTTDNQEQFDSILKNIDVSSSTITLKYKGQLKDDYIISDQENYYEFSLVQDTTGMDQSQKEVYDTYGQIFVIKKDLVDSLITLKDTDIGKNFAVTGRFMPLLEGPEPEGKFFEVNLIKAVK